MSQTPVPTLPQFQSHLKTCLLGQAFQWNLVLFLIIALQSDVSVYGSRSVEGSMYKDRDGWGGREQESQGRERKKEERLKGEGF